jgi:hypothetical protein
MIKKLLGALIAPVVLMLALTTCSNPSGGDDIDDTSNPPDTTPPAEVTNLTAAPGDGTVTLSWTDPDDTDFDHVEISVSPDSVPLTTVNKGIQTKSFKLSTGTHTFTVKTVDSTGNKSGGVTETATVAADTAIPVLSSVSAADYSLTADGTTATLRFTADEPGTYYAVVYFSATSAPANAAALKTAYDSGVTGDTKAVLSGAAAAGVNTVNISGLTKGASYKVHVTAADPALNYAAVKSTPAFVPTKVYNAEVSNISATPGVRSITLNWVNPTDTDFKQVWISISPNTGVIYAPSTNTLAIAGLNENNNYTFTIRTEDNDGNISTGVTHGPVTPLAPDDTTPPAEVTGISHILGSTNSGQITLNWTNPADTDFKRARISISPNTGVIYTPSTNTLILNLTTGTGYTFTIRTEDNDGNISDGVTYGPVTAP